MPLLGHQPATTTDNFAKMIRRQHLLVDKSLMIQTFMETTDDATLITRPRRFGKTLNMSMLHHFFSETVDGEPTNGLFDGLAIAKIDDGAFLKMHQGRYPVIAITFKDIKEPSFDAAIRKIKGLIKTVYRQYDDLLISDKLNQQDKLEWQKYRQGELDNEVLEAGHRFLSEIHRKKVILLIDEYDTPLSSAYEHEYLEPLSEFMRNLLSAALKSNPHLEKGLMTGILRVSHSSLLSGLNNLKVYTVFDRTYDSYFGFTEAEIQELIEHLQITDDLPDIRTFYNGYRIGDAVVYNPWSFMNYCS